ncbi:MAG: bifunctional glutamate N-acetyltransferase/amino-acid acetyltransferase ArgJ [Candidatus Dormibacteria bacterium]
MSRTERVGVCAPAGFRAGAAAAGIRGDGDPDRLDVAVVASDLPCRGAAVFTRNLVSAAPVEVSRQAISGGDVRAVVLNSGNANAATGPSGLRDALAMCERTALALGVDPAQVLVASTGVIGRFLPMQRIGRGVTAAVQELSAEGGERAALAIMTTDTVVKTATRSEDLGYGRLITVGGMAKGAGMLHPDMATLLAVLTTDAPVAPDLLQPLFQRCADATFNCVTVDGDTSTNDTAVLLANGAAGGKPVTPGSGAAEALEAAVEAVCQDLAEQLVADAEGATKHFRVCVQGADSVAQARRIARTVAGSTLVKTAIHGGDPNWGRILAAAGRSGAVFSPSACRVSVGALTVFDNGAPREVADDQVRHVFSQPRIEITIALDSGSAEGIAWGCDLSAEYVRINADYTT